MSDARPVPGRDMTLSDWLKRVRFLARKATPEVETWESVKMRDALESLLRNSVDLILALGECAEALEPDAAPPGPDFLDWIADRLVHVYHESEHIDFVWAIRRKAKKSRDALSRLDAILAKEKSE